MSIVTSLSSLEQGSVEDKKEYKEKMKQLQERIRLVSLYANKINRPIIVVFEGWDAAGKGGAIRRLTSSLDPRLFNVHSISAPTAEEKARNYLWRFWKKLPEKGHLTIFDRSWYGRVFVERVEGFAKEEDWRRAYREIRDFESEILSYDGILLKFFIHITPEEQLLRFKARENDPLKRYKLTEEDWRNRDKWNEYVEAYEECFRETSTPNCPWTIIPGNDKLHARISILSEFVRTCETELEIPKKFR